MKPAYILALTLALLAVPPSTYGKAGSACLYDIASGQKDMRVVNLRIIPIKDDAIRSRFWKELKRIAEPVKLIVAANQSPKDALRARCGSAPLDLQQMLIKLNPGLNLDRPGVARELTFIPCPYWAVPESHPATKRPIRKGQSLTDILPLYMGTGGEKTLKQIQRLNPNLANLLDAKNVATRDAIIQLPYVTAPVTFRLRDEISENSEEIIRKLAETFELAVPTIEIINRNISDAGLSYHLVAQDYNLFGLQDGPQGTGNILLCTGAPSSCTIRGGEDVWPFDLGQIEAIYDETRKNLQGEVRRPLILVADTGLDLSDSKSDRINQIIWNNPQVLDRRGSRYNNDLHGPNVTLNNGNINPSRGDPNADHGTEVLKVMSGGFLAPSTSSLLKAFKIAVAKITPESECSGITPRAVIDAFLYADDPEHEFVVLNLSVVASDGSAIEDGLRGTRKFLVVVAAGNNCKSVEEAGVYPPALTAFRDRLIVVGAHDWKKNITDFSNYSYSLVDLLAPGCDIPIPGKDGNTLTLSGTSFAAPFVTFTAALLGTLGLPPDAVKSRILATVDYDDDLVDRTRSAGRLSIENALSINDDILIIKDDSGNLINLHGELDRLQRWPCIRLSNKKRDYYPYQVGRVVPHYGGKGEAKVAMVWARPSQGLGALSEDKCDSLGGVVKFRLKGASSSSPFASYNWSDVISLMPKLLLR